MKKHLVLLISSLLAMSAAHASLIVDNYVGGNDHGYGDAIGGAPFDISSATVTRSGTVLKVQIMTAFAGHAGADAWAGPNGIGYGDVFLADAWTPYGTGAYTADNAANGTVWKYGFSLDNRWSNTGGVFKLYQLAGTNAQDASMSNTFLSCTLGTQCYYRDGQSTAVNTAAATVHDTGLSGSWTVGNGELDFTIDLKALPPANWQQVALHWGETCQNDVIEGVASLQDPHSNVPEPASFALFAGAGLACAAAPRRRS